MNRATPVVLLGLLVLAGTYVVFFEVRPESRWLDETERREREALVFPVDRTDDVVDSVHQFVITREGGEIVFERVGEKAWRITKPVDSLASGGVVGPLVREVLFLKKVGEDIPKEERPSGGLAAWGLEKPHVVVKLTAGTGDKKKEYELKFGGLDPTKQYVYAQRPLDEGVMRLEKGIVERLTRSVHDYRETKFVQFNRNRVRELKLRSTRTRMELAKVEGVWRVTRPYDDRADSLRLEDVMGAVEGIEARSFHAESAGNLQPLGLDVPRVEVSFTRDDNTTQTVLIGGPAEDPVGTVYAKLADEPAIYTTADDVVGKLTFLAEHLRDRKLAWVSPANVNAFRIEGAGPTVALAKSESGTWQVTEPVKVDAEADEVDAFLRALAALEIIRFPNDAPDGPALQRYGLDEKSRVTLTVRSQDKPEQVYYVGAVDPASKDLYVQRLPSVSVYTVKEVFRGRVTGTYLDFRKRQVARMSRYDMRKIEVRRPQGAFTLAKTPDDKWRMTDPVNAPADDLTVGNLLDELDNLRAVRFLTDKAPSPADYGLDKPVYELTVELKPDKDKPTETKVLLAGKEMGADGTAARLKDDEIVFTVSSTLIERLGEEYRRRTIWEVKRGEVKALSWTSAAEKGVARLEDGAWKLLEPAGRKLDEMRLDQVLGTFNYLRVDRFEDYTKDHLPKYGLDKPQVSVTITVKDVDRTISVGKEKDKDRVYVMVSDDDAVFTLPASTVKPLTASLLVPPEESEEKTE